MSAASTRRRRGVWLGLLCTVHFATACYRVIPISGAEGLRAGSRVELSLTPQGSVDMTASVGPRVERLIGELVEARPDTVVIALLRTEQANGTDNPWQRQQVRVPRNAVATFGERRLDKKRSWLTALAVGVFAVLAATVGGGIGGGAGDGQPVVTPPG